MLYVGKYAEQGRFLAVFPVATISFSIVRFNLAMDGESSKLLVVSAGRLTPDLAQYALKVATRLALEIVILFVKEDAGWTSDHQHRTKVEAFKATVEQEAAEFSTLAWKSDVHVTTVVDVNSRQSAIDQLRVAEPGIRFILSDRPQEPTANTAKDAGMTGYPKLKVIRPE